jgi:hypothetical protein
LLNTFHLIEHFLDGPETRESKHAQDGRKNGISHKKGGDGSDDSANQKDHPELHAEVVFGFDNEWVKQANDEERGQTQQYTCVVHTLNLFKKTEAKPGGSASAKIQSIF